MRAGLSREFAWPSRRRAYWISLADRTLSLIRGGSCSINPCVCLALSFESRIRSGWRSGMVHAFPGWRPGVWPGLTVLDCLTDQFSLFSADGNAVALPGLADGILSGIGLIPAMRVS